MAEIRRVLIEVWNPLMSPCEDEYDSFIGTIFGLLSKGATDDEIERELLRIEEYLLLGSADFALRQTVVSLRTIKL